MKPLSAFATLTDKDLLDQAHRVARDERAATAALIACLAEVDARRLYLGQGCNSLFAWCTDVLHLSGDAAYGRIEAARVARRYPIVLEALASGSVTMTAVALLRPHLTDANHRELLEQAHHKSKRQVEQMVAALAPKPDVPATIRRLPPPVPPVATPEREAPEILSGGAPPQVDPPAHRAVPPVAPSPLPSLVTLVSHRPVVAPLAPERYRIQFTAGRDTHDKLRRAQDLLRPSIPTGDPAKIFDRALTLLIAQLEKQKWATADKPRATSGHASRGRTIPASVRRAVSRRDEGRCAFVGPRGRCSATAFLEFHHVIPYARGGAPTEENIQLRCRAHNQYEAELAYGSRAPLYVREAGMRYEREEPRDLGGPRMAARSARCSSLVAR